MSRNGVERVVIDGRAVIKAIHNSREVQRWLGHKMEPVLEEAKRTAPDAPPIGRGYVEGLILWWGQGPDGKARARVIGTDFKSNWVEFGAVAGGKTMVLRHRTLGRALAKVR